MPGAVARTSTFALNNATLPFILALANKGPEAALADDPHLRAGLNVYRGRIAHPAVAAALGEPYWDPQGLASAPRPRSSTVASGRDKSKAARLKK
jgi:alanine dehydrogenase